MKERPLARLRVVKTDCGVSVGEAENGVPVGEVGPEPPTFVFSIDIAMLGDDEGEVAFLVPEGETAGSSIGDARLMLKASRDAAHEKSKDSRLASATEWLVNYLRTGHRPVKEIKEDSERQGHKWSTIRRASDDLEIKKPKGGP